jgi:hypothetical protein
MKKQETFPFAESIDESKKNAIVISRDEGSPEDFDTLLWVLRARLKDEKKQNLCGLFSDGQGKFTATDGHRLHVAEIPSLMEKIPAGIWLYVHSDKKKISIREAPEGIDPYPEYENLLILTDGHVKRGWIHHVEGDDSNTVWRYWDLVGIHCNIEYLLDICKGAGQLDILSCDAKNGKVSGAESLPIFFHSEDDDGKTKKAILMPFK